MFNLKLDHTLIVIVCVLLVCNSSPTDAATFTIGSLLHPAHHGKCFDTITHRVLLPDKEYKLKGICAVMTCDIKRQSINIETCPSVDMPGCEELPTDPTWSYPKCCAQFKCIDPKTGADFIVSV